MCRQASRHSTAHLPPPGRSCTNGVLILLAALPLLLPLLLLALSLTARAAV